jgi:DNA-directed RNA polymerase subunit RPC12/RpoP
MELFGRISNAAKSTVDKTANKMKIAKLQSKINAIRPGINAQKLKIGEYYWSIHHEDESFDPELASEFAAIGKLLEQIASIEAEIQGILADERLTELESAGSIPVTSGETGEPCPACGSLNDSGAKFCFNCGSSLAKPEPDPEPLPPTVCANCGARMAPGAIFCGTCGAKAENIENKDGAE